MSAQTYDTYTNGHRPKLQAPVTHAVRDVLDITTEVVNRVKLKQERDLMQRTFGFQGANVTRLNQDWWRSPMSADAELRYALRNMRFRCRELERNNDWCRKILSLFEDNVVSSTGIRLQMKIYDMVKDPETKEMVRQLDSKSCEMIEAAWMEQCSRDNYNVTRQDSDIATDKLTIRSIVRDGDIIVRKIKGYKNRFKYAIQLLEADYLDDFYSDSRTLSNGNQVRMGVELDDWKCPEAYWLLVQHPGDFNYGFENLGERYRLDAYEALHPYVKERPEQSRGYPWLVAAMNRLNMLGGYEEAELVAARLAACKSVYYTTDRPKMGEQGGGYEGPTTDQWVPMEQMEPGVNETLPQGMKPVFNDPKHPHGNFPAFSKQQLRAVASSCGVSYVSLANDLEGVNFSSIRAGLLDERETYKGVQTFYIDDVKDPVFEDWLEWVLINGFLGIQLKAKDYARLNQKVFKARRWDWVDPLKDINAAVTAIEAGLTTRSEVIANRGGDYEPVMDELHYEAGYEEKLGLNFGGAQPATAKGQFPDAEKPGEDDQDLKQTKELQALLMGRKIRLGKELDFKQAQELEARLESVMEKILARMNPKHAIQPRHPETGQWLETEKKVDGLLAQIQELMKPRTAQSLPALANQSPPPADLKLDTQTMEDIRGMIQAAVTSINYNEVGRACSMAIANTLNRPWTAGEMERHARALANPEKRGCVMANLSETDAQPITRYQQTIKKDDLYLGESGTDSYGPDYGIETEPHITVLYGLTDDDAKDVIAACKEFGELTATLGPIEAFHNDKYDVLKVTVNSESMHKLNTELRKLPHENDYPDYQPHLTLAYLKTGKAKEYVGNDAFKGETLKFDSVVFSDSAHKKTEISLRGRDAGNRDDAPTADLQTSPPAAPAPEPPPPPTIDPALVVGAADPSADPDRTMTTGSASAVVETEVKAETPAPLVDEETTQAPEEKPIEPQGVQATTELTATPTAYAGKSIEKPKRGKKK